MFLLLLRLHVVSIGVTFGDSGDLGGLNFFFFLALGRTGDFGTDSDGSLVGDAEGDARAGAVDAGTDAGDTGTGTGGTGTWLV